MKQKAVNALWAGILFCILMSVPFHSFSGGGGGGAPKKAPQPLPACPSLIKKTIPLYLSFDGTTANGCAIPSTSNSDYRNRGGASSLTDNTTYYCVIKVVAINPGGCGGTSQVTIYTGTWTTRTAFMNITVARNKQSKVTVEYYEACATDCNGTTGRPYLRYETTLFGNETFVNAPLSFKYISHC